jgi:hypothetical protein
VPWWAARYGDATDQAGTSVVVDANGNLLLAGGFVGTIDFGVGKPLGPTSGTGDVFLVEFGP